MAATVSASPLLPKYGEAIDRDSAREILARKMDDAAAADEAARAADDKAQSAKDAEAEYQRMQREWEKTQRTPRTPARTPAPRKTPAPRRTTKKEKSPVDEFLGSSVGRQVVRSVVQGIFGTLRRR
jgi:ferric-dicitrate binding protein FerR (iron transport regulator)